MSQGGSFELYVGGVQEAGGASALVVQGYNGSAYAERARIASTGQMSTTNGAGSVALAYDARAWVNFNGTGTVAIRASGNVSSITDNGTGDYTVNFSTAMPDANYAICMGPASPSSTSGTWIAGVINANANSAPYYSAPLAASCRVVFGNFGTGTGTDVLFANVAIFR
jgi:hypothetical protein